MTQEVIGGTIGIRICDDGFVVVKRLSFSRSSFRLGRWREVRNLLEGNVGSFTVRGKEKIFEWFLKELSFD